MEQQFTSTRPYFIRALYEWLVDNNLTPHLLVDAEHGEAKVPRQYVKEGRIVFNVNPGAVRDLDMGNEWISFNARFSGTPFAVYFPVDAVLGIYSRENGQGMFFQPEAEQKTANAAPPPETSSDEDNKEPPRPPRGKPTLKRVK